MEFYKYHGTGNDFIIIDNRRDDFPDDEERIARICHRRLGIGADGLMLLEISDKYDFRMRYFNSDGREGSMCGNGGRCITGFARLLGLIGSEAHIEAVDGLHHAIITAIKGEETHVKLTLKDVNQIEKGADYFFLDTGSPHYVQFVSNLDEMDVVHKGRTIRNLDKYKDHGTNVDFAEIRNETLFVRSFERGVEDETLSCGTGVTAAAIALSLLHPEKNIVDVDTLGGRLTVSFRKAGDVYKDVCLEGPARFVFRGEIDMQKI